MFERNNKNRVQEEVICPGGVVVDSSSKSYLMFERNNKNRVQEEVICPGGEIGRRKGLKILSTQVGNVWCEWCQIRGNLSGNADGNPERSLINIRNV